MAHELETEFASYREALETEEEKLAFDKEIVLLLERRGVDYGWILPCWSSCFLFCHLATFPSDGFGL